MRGIGDLAEADGVARDEASQIAAAKKELEYRERQRVRRSAKQQSEKKD